MARRLIGTGTTDSNGRITVSYTGTGAGKLQLVAVNGNLLSETYVLEDLVFYDHAYADDYNSNYGNQWTGNEATITRNTLYTSLTGDSSSAKYLVWNFRDYEFSTIEFDLKKVGGATNDIILQLRNNSYSVLRQVALSTFSDKSLDTWYHFKFDFENKLIYCGDNSVDMTDIIPTKFMFAVATSTTELQYRNFKVY